MNESCTRREVLLALWAMGAAACASGTSGGSSAPAVAQSASRPADSLAAIESRVGGRVGVFALDTGTGRTLAHRENERFAMCSTFKWALAAAVLGMVDRSEAKLDERISYGQADLLETAPVTKAHVAEGGMTIEALARAVLTVSDNTAANLLLAKVGGPAGMTGFFRAQGDQVTRLDRNEPTMSSNDPGDARDTTSPQAMVGLMRAVLCGDVLSRPSRDRLLDGMRACETGRNRLRAGLPAGWVVADKTGTGYNGACNDLAMVVPPGRAPILIAAYLSESEAEGDALEAAHAGIARLVASTLG
ncbi:MAG TPA: class A beta-lactamase [Polyangiaceae bacterium]